MTRIYLQKNTSIVNLNLSWNGFAFEGSIVLEEALKLNKSIRVLDISNNRINWDGVVYIARGLKSNTTIQMLKVRVRWTGSRVLVVTDRLFMTVTSLVYT